MTKFDFSGLNVILIPEVDSTNNYATGLLSDENIAEGTIVLTFRQIRGRGHGKNVWDSQDFMNLTFSLILYPRFMHASRQFLLSQVVSLGITGFLKSKTSGVTIKWPNDILINEMKVAGILIENCISGNLLQSSVIGIGLNLNQEHFPDHLPRAISLAGITGENYQPDHSLKEVVKEIFMWYDHLKNNRIDYIQEQYMEHLFRFGKKSLFRADDGLFEATITGVDEYGQLLLQKINGQTTAWPFQSVEMIY
jgi:BirA family biotin operon repressor/biotin-[acetyl-CoA-carboxylase] ligase